MIPVTELRSGTVFEDQGNVFVVVSYEHIKMGRGAAEIKLKVRNIRTGATTNKGFGNNARVRPLRISKRDLQYLYKDEDSAYFMHPQTFEQVVVALPRLSEDHVYLKDGDSFNLSFLDEEFIALNLPPKMEFAIADTGPSIKGNSASNMYKDAVLENGNRVRVPLFLKVGDRIRVYTRTGAYSEKV